MKHITVCLVVLCGLLALSSLAQAKSAVISVPMNQVGAHSGERGAFYVVNVSLPEDIAGKRLDGVFVEFAIEAIPLVEDSVTVTPVVGVYPLTATYTEEGIGDGPGRNAEPVFSNLVPSSRPVAAGANRAVRMDITDIVRGWMANPSTNYGLVIGSLTGPEVATVTLKSAIPGGETPVRITFLYQNRFGDRISSRQ